MGVASTAGSAEVKPDGTYLTPGDYGLLQVNALKEIDTDDKLAFIAEMIVLESSGDGSLPAGMDGTLYIDCRKFKGQLAGEVKTFLAALTSTPIEEVDEDGIAATLTTDQPCVGMVVKCKAWAHTTKNDKVITKHKWFPASEDDKARVKEVRANLNLPELAVA